MYKSFRILFVLLCCCTALLGRAQEACPSWDCKRDKCSVSNMLSISKVQAQDPCVLKQWTCDPCIVEVLNWLDNAQQNKEEFTFRQEQIRNIGNYIPRFFEHVFYENIRNAAGSNLAVTQRYTINKDVCMQIYSSMDKGECPSFEELQQNENSWGWFNVNCLTQVKEFIKKSDAAAIGWVVDGINRGKKLSACCKNDDFKNANYCDNSDKYWSVRNTQSEIMELLKQHGYFAFYAEINGDGHVSSYTYKKGKGESAEVVPDEAIGGRGSPERTKKAVEEYFANYEAYRPPSAGNTGGIPPGQDTANSVLTQDDCRELGNKAHSAQACDLAPLFYVSSLLDWAQPSCLDELYKLLKNEQKFENTSAQHGGELAFLDRLFFAQRSAQKSLTRFESCRKNFPFMGAVNESYKTQVSSVLDLLNNRGGKYKSQCRSLESKVKQNSCAAAGETLLLDANVWETPVCISGAADYFSSVDPNTQADAMQFIKNNWESIQPNLQRAFDAFSEYRACLRLEHIKSNETDFNSFKESTQKLEGGLYKIGVKFNGERIQGEPFAEEDGAEQNRSSAAGKASTSFENESEDSSGEGGAEQKGAPVGAKDATSQRWDDRAGGLFRLRFLEPTHVGTVDTVPEIY